MIQPEDVSWNPDEQRKARAAKAALDKIDPRLQEALETAGSPAVKDAMKVLKEAAKRASESMIKANETFAGQYTIQPGTTVLSTADDLIKYPTFALTEPNAFKAAQMEFEYATLHGGEKILCHAQKECYGQVCSVHNPSNHFMKDWPQHWRNEGSKMERMCGHGVGHPDPDDVLHRVEKQGLDVRTATTHGCDGCCSPGTEMEV